jgi:homoserine O-acetyltransferase
MSAILEPNFEGDFTFAREQPFRLEAGGELQPVTLQYATYGRLNASQDNAILVCHALSGSARVADWWPEMFAPGGAFDTSRFCIIGSNVIGSCYGSTGPRSTNPRTGTPYACDFPLVTIADMVRAQVHLLDHLSVRQLRMVIGGSIGGMQALQWAIDFPDRLETCVSIGATPLSAMGLALDHLQRQAIQNDPTWRNGRYPLEEQPAAGLALARAIAMCSYKSAELFTERFGRRPNRIGEDPYHSIAGRFDIAGYLDHQGEKLVARFDANTYIVLSKAMDVFDPSRGYGSEGEAFARIRAKVLLVGITSDWLFPPADVRVLAQRMSAAGVRCRYAELKSSHGHDGFLADPDLLIALLAEALEEDDHRSRVHHAHSASLQKRLGSA